MTKVWIKAALQLSDISTATIPTTIMSNLTAIANGPSTSSPSDGSRTQVIQDSQPRADEGSSDPSQDQESTPHGVLRLRGGPRSKPAVVWKDDVIDNENMGKKSSKSTSNDRLRHA